MKNDRGASVRNTTRTSPVTWGVLAKKFPEPSRSIFTGVSGSVRNVRMRDSGATLGKGTRVPERKSATTLPQKRSRGRSSGGAESAPSTGSTTSWSSPTPSTGVPSSMRAIVSSEVTRLKGATAGVNTS